MALEFIPAWLAVTFLVVGIMGLVFRSKIANAIARMNPLFPAQTTLLIVAIAGILAGGLPLLIGGVTGLFSGSVASVTGVGGSQSGAVMSEVVLSECVYDASNVQATNVTARADPSSRNKVYFDIDKSEYTTQAVGAQALQIANFTCTRTGNTEEAATVRVVAKTDTFKSDTSTTDVTIYDLASQSVTPSAVWSGTYTRSIVIEGDNTQVVASDTNESDYLEFAAGKKTQRLSVGFHVANSSIANLNTYNLKTLHIYQRSEAGQDSEVAQVIVNAI